MDAPHPVSWLHGLSEDWLAEEPGASTYHLADPLLLFSTCLSRSPFQFPVHPEHWHPTHTHTIYLLYLQEGCAEIPLWKYETKKRKKKNPTLIRFPYLKIKYNSLSKRNTSVLIVVKKFVASSFQSLPDQHSHHDWIIFIIFSGLRLVIDYNVTLWSCFMYNLATPKMVHRNHVYPWVHVHIFKHYPICSPHAETFYGLWQHPYWYVLQCRISIVRMIFHQFLQMFLIQKHKKAK